MKQVVYIWGLCLILWAGHFSAGTHPAWAQQTEANSPLAQVEHTLQRCLEMYPGTSSEAQCYREQATTLETEIRRLYTALGGDQNAALKHSHRIWRAYLDSERQMLEKMYFVPGSQSERLKAEAYYRLLHTRASALQRYLNYAHAHQ